MRFDDALDLLTRRADVLPSGPTELEPQVLQSSTRQPEWMARALSGPTRDAAALVLLFPSADGEAHVVLIERQGGDHAHAGQVALPGGRRDEGDAFPEGTALREAAEEVGLDRVAARVTTMGVLDTVDVRVSGFMLVPVLAAAPSEPRLVEDGREVAHILRVPVAAFLPGAPIEMVEEMRDGWRLRYGAYPVAGRLIWGATARVLGQLGAILGADR